MRLFITILFILFSTNAGAFQYEKVYECGKKLGLLSSEISHSDRLNQYYIHFGNFDEIIIWHIGFSYQTFEAKKYEHLWLHNGVITKLVVTEKMDEIIKFEMQHLNNNFKKILILNLKDLSYSARPYNGDKKGEPEYGFCKLVYPW